MGILALKSPGPRAKLAYMKVLSIDEAQTRFSAVCEEALAGEVIRLQHRSGALLELTPVPGAPAAPALSNQELAACYDDPEWAAFENHCALAND